MRSAPSSAYVHLPFCRKKCFYCDFPIAVVKKDKLNQNAEQYVNLVIKEIKAASKEKMHNAPPLKTLYFGGGTPSLTPPSLVKKLVQEMKFTFGIDDNAEITLEADPGTFDKEELFKFAEAGISRISLGVQSFDEALLSAAGRAHGLDEVDRALELLRGSEIGQSFSLSIDLIGGLPHQTMKSWRTSLTKAASCGANHVSVYDLQVEPGTAFGKWYSPGSAPLPSEELAANMFIEASSVLQAAGFEHYEISSYAKPGARSRHNSAYWSNSPFWAFGLGATSFTNSIRFARPRQMREYAQWVNRLEERGLAREERESGTAEPPGELDALQTKLMLSLRTSDGVDLRDLAAEYPLGGLGQAAICACVDMSRIHPEWMTLTGGGGRLRLSDPQGMLFSNEAISSIFAALDERLEGG